MSDPDGSDGAQADGERADDALADGKRSEDALADGKRSEDALADGKRSEDAVDPTPDIQHLDERTVQRIAAGEVVERPASVVKELVENSLDADATRVSVAVENGGKDGIRVHDNGVGIPRDQLAAAVAEHATSKISDIDDLDAGVGTLGFRGEALYTVGAVSRLTLRSRPRGENAAGAEITVEGGDVGEPKTAGCPEGTTVEVTDLFYNTPAREKFLKTDATEFDHVNTVVTQYALANPDVAVSLEHNGREVFATEGNGDLRSAVLAVYGREVAESMVDVSWEPTDHDSPVNRVHGVVSHPETTRAGRDYLATFVNDRYVTASVLRSAVVDAYGGQLAPDRYPFAVLFVDVPPESVDVNVHPRKMEVRFDEESAVKATVEDAAEGALLDHGLIRSTAPRGRSAPDEAEVVPQAGDDDEVSPKAGEDDGATSESGDSRAEDEAGPEHERDSGDIDSGNTGEKPANAATAGSANTPENTSALDPDAADAWAVDGLGGGSGASGPGADGPDSGADIPSTADSSIEPGLPDHDPSQTDRERPSPRSWQQDGGDSGTTSEATPSSEVEPTNDDGPEGARTSDHTDASNDLAESNSGGATSSTASPTETANRVTGAANQRTLDGATATAEREYESLPPLRVLGQLHETYVVAEAPQGLVLIDQHAADERVNYERLQREFADGASAQALAEPVSVELTAREAALFEEFADALESMGFRAERDGDRQIAVSAVPAVFDATLDPELVQDVLGAFVSDAAAGEAPVADVVDELLADLACYPSVTGNTSLTEGSVVDLLAALDDCQNPYACPHGRPVVIAFERGNIEDRFERDYPGHSGRRAE